MDLQRLCCRFAFNAGFDVGEALTFAKQSFPSITEAEVNGFFEYFKINRNETLERDVKMEEEEEEYESPRRKRCRVNEKEQTNVPKEQEKGLTTNEMSNERNEPIEVNVTEIKTEVEEEEQTSQVIRQDISLNQLIKPEINHEEEITEIQIFLSQSDVRFLKKLKNGRIHKEMNSNETNDMDTQIQNACVQLKQILEIPDLKLERLSIEYEKKNNDNVAKYRKKFLETIRRTMTELTHKINVERLIVTVENQCDIEAILRKIDSRSIRLIMITENPEQKGILDLNSVLDIDDYPNLSHLLVYAKTNIPLDKFHSLRSAVAELIFNEDEARRYKEKICSEMNYHSFEFTNGFSAEFLFKIFTPNQKCEISNEDICYVPNDQTHINLGMFGSNLQIRNCIHGNLHLPN